MPKQLFGAARKVIVDSGAGEDPPAPTASVQYGKASAVSLAQTYKTKDTPSGRPELIPAAQLMSATFGLIYICAKDSYRGSVPTLPGGYAPGVRRTPSSRPVWFSCRIDGAEGDENFSGHAVGWTSAKTAWLVVARDENTVRALVTVLHQAAS